MERGRSRPHGAVAVSCALSVLRGRRPLVMSALPAQRRRLPRRAVQHRVVRAADDDGGAGVRSRTGRLRAHASVFYLFHPPTHNPNPTTNKREALSPRGGGPLPFPSMKLNPEVKSIF